MQPHIHHLLAAEHERALIVAADRARAASPARRRARRMLITAVLPAAFAVALPQAADAATVEVRGTTLFIEDLESDNVRSVSNSVSIRQLTDGRLVVADSRGVSPRAGCVPAFEGVACSGANSVISFLHNGNDSYVNSVSLPTTLIAGAGNDRLHTGGQPGASQVTFSGREGIDTVSYASAARGVSVLKSGAADDGRPGDRDNIFADVEDVIGSRFADNLTGSAGNDLFSGLGGDDTLSGGAGLDTFSMSAGADGADLIFGGPDFDSVEYNQRTQPVTVNLSDGGADDGETGERDELREIERAITGAGDDTLKANPASQVGVSFDSGSGKDTITGTDQADSIGAAGIDRKGDTIDARGGNDLIGVRDSEVDTVACGQGTDTIRADLNNNGITDVMSGCEDVRSTVGVLALSPRALEARAGRIAKVAVSWRHTRADGRIARVKLQVRDGGRPVAELAISPRGNTMRGAGAVAVVRRSSRLDRRGKTVRAVLGLRLDPSLAGHKLSLDVEAADTQGHRQLERDAGTIRVTK